MVVLAETNINIAAQVQPSNTKTKLSKPKSKNAFDANSLAWQSNLRGDDTFVTAEDGSRPAWFWTGRRPEAGSPGMLPDGTVTSLPLPDLATCSRQQALDYFDNTWLITEVIFSGLQGEEAFYRPPFHNLRHPKIFYYAHPAVLYINKFRVAGLLDEGINPEFEHIFETGVDEMSWDDLSKNEMVWPAVREVTEYRREAYRRIRRVIETCPDFDHLPITWDSPAWAIFMGIEHERIHIETSTVLIRELPSHLVQKPLWWPSYHPGLLPSLSAPENVLIDVPGADVTIGKPLDWPSFGWDNEYGRREFQVRPFRATKFLVSNAEMLEFVKAGGYTDSKLWTEEGWNWRTFRNAKWPAYWSLDGPAGLHRYKLRLIWELVDMPMAAPAIVNLHEAKAYCNWRSRVEGKGGDEAYRLITEVEHKRIRLAALAPAGLQGSDRAAADPVMHMTGVEMRPLGNGNLAWGAESPVDGCEPTAAGFHDSFGNAWQWCEDLIASLPNSHGIHTYYEDFSTPCYDGQHHVILGGSFMSTGDEVSIFARFHFRPHFHQHASFRMVQGSGPMTTTHMDSPPPHVGSWKPVSNAGSDSLDTASHVALKMLTHYPSQAIMDPLSGILNQAALQFPQQASSMIVAMCDKYGVEKQTMLELGCSVGGCTFRFAEQFKFVMGIDLEAQMIQAAKDMQENGFVVVRFKEEGKLHSKTTVARPVPSDISARVEFRQMDPCCIAPDIGAFDVVVVNDILDRIASPRSPLGRMGGVHGIVKPGGLLMIIAAYDWDPRVSDPKSWLGGLEDGKPSRAGLESMIGTEFSCVAEQELQYVMREHKRKFSLVLANATIWRRQL